MVQFDLQVSGQWNQLLFRFYSSCPTVKYILRLLESLPSHRRTNPEWSAPGKVPGRARQGDRYEIMEILPSVITYNLPQTEL